MTTTTPTHPATGIDLSDLDLVTAGPPWAAFDAWGEFDVVGEVGARFPELVPRAEIRVMLEELLARVTQR